MTCGRSSSRSNRCSHWPVDEPMPDGRMQNKLVWYLVYSVKNTSDKPVTFVPYFVLVGNDTHKVYPSRVIPLAVR